MFFVDVTAKSKNGKIEVVSVRDGVQEYLGSEIGAEDPNKIYKVYRSADTVKKIKDSMIGIPVTNGHVELEDKINDDIIVGEVKSSSIENHTDKEVLSTVKIVNEIKLKNNVLQFDGKSQLSLGYFADLVPSDTYDFEQIDMFPHHLALVKNARCGDTCKIKDERKDMEEEENKGAENSKEMEKPKSVVETLEKHPIAKVILEAVKNKVEDSEEVEDEIPTPTLEEALNWVNGSLPKRNKLTEKEINKAKEDFKDSAEFKDAVKSMADERVDTILKARQFLDESYDFSKCTTQIMKDAVATQYPDKFTDSEVKVAFKMLKKTENYANFADSKEDEFSKIADKEL